MFEKNGKYFADWFDENNRRIRKSFTSKAKASAYEKAMKDAKNPCQTRAALPRSSRRGGVKASTNTTQTRKQSTPSSRLVVISHRKAGNQRQ